MTIRLRVLRDPSRTRLFVALCGSIGIGELLVMLLMAQLPPLPLWGDALLGAALLMGVLFPILYFLVFRPLTTDIRKHEQGDKSLREFEAQLRATLDSTMDGILAVDSEGRVLHTNRRFAELWRIPPPLAERGDDRALLEFVLDQLVDPGAFLAKVEALYGSDETGTDTLYFKDGRVFERFSVPMYVEGARRGRVWSFRDVTERRRAERALQESEHLFRESQRVAQLGSYRLDVVADTWKSSEVMDQIFGIDAEYERTVHGWLDLVHPDDRAMMQQYFEREVLGDHRPFDKEYRIVRKADGDVRRVHGLGALSFDDAGRLLNMTGTIQDITERKRAEFEREVMHDIAQAVAASSNLDELLRLMHHSLQRVFEAENCFVALHDPKTGLFGFPYFADQHDSLPAPSAMTKSCTAYVFRSGKPVLVTPAVARQLREQHETELVGSPSRSWMGVPLRTPSGTIGVLVLQDYETENIYTERDLAFLASVGSQVAVVIERKLAEESLRSSERKLREAQRVARVGSWELDLASGSMIWSESLSRMVGRDPHQPAPAYADLHRYYTPESWQRIATTVEAATKGARFELDLEAIREEGGHWWQTVRGEAVRSPLGEVVGLHGTVLDITERRQAEQAAAVFEAQLQQAQKMETVGRLAGGVAHDFNNMLAVILGHVELALSRVDSEQPLHEDLTSIQKAATRSADLTRQLLAYARRQAIVPKLLDLDATVPAVLAMLRRLLGENVGLMWRPAEDLWPVSVDQSQVDQLLTNLCVNARDAIDGIGTVRIATANCIIDAQFCAMHADAVPGEFVRLSVADDGRGMSGDVLAHLFEPFFTTKGVGAGTGLGLATVYGTVRQNNGFITVASAPGQGTTFDVYFPRHAGQIESAGQAPEAAGPSPRGDETILLVEDEPSLLRMTARALEARGYHVLCADGPGEAIRLAEAFAGEIDLLLTDVLMPEMNGRDLAETLVHAHTHLKYLFMSGFSENVSLGREPRSDGAHFIAKPFTIAALTAKVREVLDRE
ncbi:MAG: PAS domain S-box protein [Gemmatimonadaceae bacterium]|nr:PAS domain S-box protein [Gemmatimonadaceae bacterium]